METLLQACWLLLLFAAKLVAFPYQGAHLIESLGLEQGLSQATAVVTLQDSQGYIWVGTQDGLNRYDGKNFLQYRYRVNNERSLSGNYVSGLALDGQQRLWVLTPQGLNLYQAETNDFKRFSLRATGHHRSVKSPWKLKSDHRGRLWISSGGGLSLFDPDSHREVSLPLDEAMLPIDDFIFSPDHRFWVMSQQQLYEWHEEKQQLQPVPFPLQAQDQLISLTLAPNVAATQLWLASSQGLYRYDVSQQTTRFYAKQDLGITAKLTDLEFDPQGQLWMGTQAGLYVWELDSPRGQFIHHQIGDRLGIADGFIRQLYFDRTGVLWIGTRLGGISRLTPQAARFHLLNQAQGLMRDDVVMSLAKFDDQLWLGSADGAISQIDLAQPKVKQWRPLSEIGQDLGVIVDIEQDAKGNVWFASNRGLAKYQLEQDKFEFYTIKGPNGQLDNYISQLFMFKGTLWIASARFGLARYDQTNDDFVFLEQGKVTLGNVSSAVVADDQLWLGTFDGRVWQLDFSMPEGYTVRSHELSYLGEPLKLDVITQLYQADSGAIWITNRNGLVAYQPGQGDVQFLSSHSGFPSGAYYEILPSHDGTVWVTHAHALLQLDQQGQLLASYDTDHGLPVKEFNDASAISDDGTLFFGSVNGLLAFNPAPSSDDNSTLPVVFTEIKTQFMQANTLGTKAWHKAPQHAHALALPYDNATVALGFSDLDFSHSPSYFRYRLLGLDQHWNLVESGHTEAIYHQLAPGKYQFEVEVSKQLDGWPGVANVLPITVATPWWQSWWALLCYALSMMLVVYGYIRIRLRVADKQARKLRLQVKQRTRTIEQLLMQKVRVFANVATELRTPITLIQAPVQLLKQQIVQTSALAQLNLIETQTNQVMAQLDRFVTLTHPLPSLAMSSACVQDWQGIISGVVEQLKDALALNRVNIKLSLRGPLRVKGTMPELEAIAYHLLAYMVGLAKKGATVCAYGRVWDRQVRLWVAVEGLKLEAHQRQTLLSVCHETSAMNALRLDELGLMMLQETLTRLSGSVSVSDHGHGLNQSVVLISLPVAQVDVATDAPSAVRGDLSSWLKHKKQPDLMNQPVLLLLTSSVSMADFLRSVFSEQYAVLIASSHHSAIVLAQKHLPRAMIVDVNNGLSLCAELKQQPPLSSLPILMLAAELDAELKLAAWQAGIYQVVQKPFELAELRALVTNMMQLSMTPEPLLPQDAPGAFMARLDAILALDFADPDFTINLLADKMGVNTKQLQRKLKQATDMTPNEYLRQYRLEQARQLLAEPLTIQEVSLRCGFNSPSYFTSCYKKAFNQTPKQAQGQGVELE